MLNINDPQTPEKSICPTKYEWCQKEYPVILQKSPYFILEGFLSIISQIFDKQQIKVDPTLNSIIRTDLPVSFSFGIFSKTSYFIDKCIF